LSQNVILLFVFLRGGKIFNFIVLSRFILKYLNPPVSGSIRFIFPVILTAVVLINFPSPLSAKVTGPCANCHTMHNSQNGANVNHGPYGYPSRALLSKDGAYGPCWACHAKGLSTNIDPVTGAPQVYHTGPVDNAAGNFAYITGAKGSGSSDRKGHNMYYFRSEGAIKRPPGGNISFDNAWVHNLSCMYCHGIVGSSYAPGNNKSDFKGTHHGHTGNKFDNPTTPATSYRLLTGVAGLENNGQNDPSSKYQNRDANNHNEYFGANTPPATFYRACEKCHQNYGKPPSRSISEFCGLCHGDFHSLEDISRNSIWVRHPTDVILPNAGEYSAYTSYSIQAPVARTTVPDEISNVVTPGQDVVSCLTCHMAHASNYPSMLRWDYNTMIAGGGGSGGCFTCHTTKK
jgi:hypothetical protein